MKASKTNRKKNTKNRRRQDLVTPTRARRKRLSGWLIGSFITSVSVVAIYAVGNTANKAVTEITDRPISAVEIEAAMEHVSESELQSLMQPMIGQRFLGTDLTQLKANIEQHPWIAQANLSRRWPDRLHIALQEETAIARWRDTGFLNHAGKEIVLGDNQSLMYLPKLSGPKESQLEVAKQFVEINRTLQPMGLSVNEMILSEDLSWQIELSNGLFIKLGRDQLQNKMERFSTVFESTLKPRLAEIQSVDLRYRNGVAVKWIKQEISSAN
ncbi:cell division protein FtsQ/DivIB [Halioxenophilus aromaticivorans]|uniref:Cell division protein FtsQ n=1 Tax=Halioxenophilus aromaticivorans TaxID=1306992 RepID=A0AAV3TYQ0_9ALTE